MTLGPRDATTSYADRPPAPQGGRPGGPEPDRQDRAERELRAPSALASAARLPEVRWSGLALVLFALGGAAQLAGAPAPVWWTLYLACYAAGGWEPALEGVRALRERTLDVDVLMIVAALAAAAIGQVVDGALLIVIFSTSGALEAFVTRRTADSVDALLALAPDRASRVLPNGTTEQVDAAALAVGDVVLVRPGERLPADGAVLDGRSDVDQATITGEPLPVVRGPGDEVWAGTVNGTGALRVRVEREAGDTVVARIVAMVEEATRTKARTQLFIERVEQRYSVVVVVATLALLGVPLAAGAAFEPTLLRAMTFMIVASPCAIVLATMPPLLAVIANAGRHGVLVRSAVALEELRSVDLVAFDKTGTLTSGRPALVGVHPCGDATAAELLALAAAAEAPSEHPVGRAVVAAAEERGLVVPPCGDFAAAPGRGVRAVVEGRVVEVGAPALLDAAAERVAEGQEAGYAAAPARELRDRVATAEGAGRTVVVVLADGAARGLLVLEDEVRTGAAEAVGALEALGRRTALLSGDQEVAARSVAERTGVGESHGALLPDEKARELARMAEAGARTAFVGDGVNDAPAMATARVGIAMGRRSSDLAVETADVVLVRDDLEAIPRLVGLAERAHRVVVANLVIAATVIVVLVTWDLVATLPLPLGVAGHEGSTVVVGLNGLRLLRRSAWR